MLGALVAWAIAGVGTLMLAFERRSLSVLCAGPTALAVACCAVAECPLHLARTLASRASAVPAVLTAVVVAHRVAFSSRQLLDVVVRRR